MMFEETCGMQAQVKESALGPCGENRVGSRPTLTGTGPFPCPGWLQSLDLLLPSGSSLTAKSFPVTGLEFDKVSSQVFTKYPLER